MNIKKDPAWLIWSNEHGLWWKPNQRGYTQRVEEAGLYTLDEAIKICTEANFLSNQINEVLCPSREMLDFLRDSE